MTKSATDTSVAGALNWRGAPTPAGLPDGTTAWDALRQPCPKCGARAYRECSPGPTGKRAQIHTRRWWAAANAGNRD